MKDEGNKIAVNSIIYGTDEARVWESHNSVIIISFEPTPHIFRFEEWALGWGGIRWLLPLLLRFGKQLLCFKRRGSEEFVQCPPPTHPRIKKDSDARFQKCPPLPGFEQPPFFLSFPFSGVFVSSASVLFVWFFGPRGPKKIEFDWFKSSFFAKHNGYTHRNSSKFGVNVSELGDFFYVSEAGVGISSPYFLLPVNPLSLFPPKKGRKKKKRQFFRHLFVKPPNETGKCEFSFSFSSDALHAMLRYWGGGEMREIICRKIFENCATALPGTAGFT